MTDTPAPPAPFLTRPQAQALAVEFAATLDEPALDLLQRVIRHLGEDAARAFLAQTLEVEAQGGMVTADGSRRRTPGGVFCQLVRATLSRRDRYRLFPPTDPTPPADAAPSAAEIARLAQEAWAGRAGVVQELIATHVGGMTTMKVTLIGRPGAVQQPGPFVVTTMKGPGKSPTLPKGLPLSN